MNHQSSEKARQELQPCTPYREYPRLDSATIDLVSSTWLGDEEGDKAARAGVEIDCFSYAMTPHYNQPSRQGVSQGD